MANLSSYQLSTRAPVRPSNMHGSGASRMLKTLAQGVDVCVTVTLVDAYVLARSAFHHSMNYRSVTVLGRARLVAEEAEKMAALRVITDHIVPGRWDEVRGPNELEMKQTVVLALPLEEVAAKVRTGPPVDDDEDYALPFGLASFRSTHSLESRWGTVVCYPT